MNPETLLPFYTDHLFGHILPFWSEGTVDFEHGGYYTCFANRGKRLLARHKFTWSQGRFVWVWSRLAGQFRDRRPRAETDRYLEYAGLGARFLMRHALLANGNCTFLLSEAGEPIVLGADGVARAAAPGEVYDTSIYADCFVVYGISEYARLTGDRAAFDFATTLFDRVSARLASGDYRTDPYPVPRGYKAQGIPMIMLETTRELALTCDAFADGRAAGLRRRCAGYAAEIMGRFLQADGALLEYLGDDDTVRPTMLGTYTNPGHTLECMWFVMHYAAEARDRALMDRAAEVVGRTMRVGWDEAYGGLPQFTARDGGRPEGPVPPEHEGQPMIDKLRTAWDNKLWWPHSEALYALLLAHRHSGDPALLGQYDRVHDYTFATFPQPEGEWIQIRDRAGRPEDKVVALPVKDPFHIPRAFLHIIRLLETPAGT